MPLSLRNYLDLPSKTINCLSWSHKNGNNLEPVQCFESYLLLFFSGMFAIRAERDYVIEEDFMKAVRKVADNKKLESKLDYKPI